MPTRGRLSGMPGPDGFTYQQRANGDVVILHRGRAATTLRGARALEFLADVGGPPGDQELMARVTGNYKRGNERLAAQHPRNRGGNGKGGKSPKGGTR